MTSFDIYESSTEESHPLEVYLITIGSTTYRYTSNATDITLDSNVYTAIPIKRSKIAVSRERKEQIDITFPSTNTFAKSFLGVVPGERAFVSIIRLQRDEIPTFDTQALIFKGQIGGGGYGKDGNVIKLTARSIEAATGRPIPRFTFMGMCNHILFDGGCQVAEGLFNGGGSVTAVTDNVITVPGANTQPDGYWTGGWVKPDATSDFRLILAHSGNDLTLLLPFSSTVLGANVTFYAGCDHTFDGDCATKFDNVLNFGGFPFVPTKNVFITGLD